MAFFQSSVLKNYLTSINSNDLNDAYKTYQKYFHDLEIQNNILTAKEEQFQEGFLRELFVKVLGYKLNPSASYNLTTELKNAKNAKKCDGAILRDKTTLAVIELKGADTTDLGKVNSQAFGYKNNHVGCIYVITSNFYKLRFYIHNAVEHIEFDLFTLNKDDFALMWLCIGSDSLLNDIPLRIKNESIAAEEEVTQKLYSEYALFRNELWESSVTCNPSVEKLVLYEKIQKLIDRFLFMLFAEDCGLLPPNSIKSEIERWKKLAELDAYKPLYDIFKQYFGYIDKGQKSKSQISEIYAYNGGLFAQDKALDMLRIDDDVLLRNLNNISNYDFNSEIDVNILGHIFENSLNEIESIKNELSGKDSVSNVSRRKKDGVYYTPKYVTQYIVRNTIGLLCEDKIAEFNIDEKDYNKKSKGRKKSTLAKLKKQLDEYRSWLLGITICDPACGSGAFLNQALEHLISEHRYIDELESKLFGKLNHNFVSDYILENNLYGVDINEESVEIAKLSLWLRTAKKGRKLKSLSNNIKCGNSLLSTSDDPSRKAFLWNIEFSHIFNNGGFDVILGNPPYIKEHNNRAAFRGLEGTEYYQGKMDLWTYFGCKAIDLVKQNGLVGFIAPNNWISNSGASIFRNKILTSGKLIKYIDFRDFSVFDDASIQTMIYVFRKNIGIDTYVFPHTSIVKSKPTKLEIESAVEGNSADGTCVTIDVALNSSELIDQTIAFNDRSINRVLDKLEKNSNYKLASEEIGNGIDVLQDFLTKKHVATLKLPEGDVGKGALILTQKEIDQLKLNDNEYIWLKPYFDSKSLRANHILDHRQDKFILYADKEFRDNIEKYPNLKKYLDSISPILTSAFKPYGLHRARDESFFSEPSIYCLRKTMEPSFTFNPDPCYVTRSFMIVKPKNIDMNYLTAFFNSKISSFWFFYKGKLQGSQLQIDKEPLTRIPLLNTTNDKTNSISNWNCELSKLQISYDESISNFLRFLNSKYTNLSLTKLKTSIIENDASAFLTELNSSNEISLKSQQEWEELFTQNCAEAKILAINIDKLVLKIDEQFFNLFKLSKKDIDIVLKR